MAFEEYFKKSARISTLSSIDMLQGNLAMTAWSAFLFLGSKLSDPQLENNISGDARLLADFKTLRADFEKLENEVGVELFTRAQVEKLRTLAQTCNQLQERLSKK